MRNSGRAGTEDRRGSTGTGADDRDEDEAVVLAERPDSGDAFMDDPEDGPALIDDDLAETLAEEFIQSATTGNDSADESMDRLVPEEIGGPFVETSALDEFADGVDDSNPEDARREPLPRAVHGLSTLPPGGR